MRQQASESRPSSKVRRLATHGVDKPFPTFKRAVISETSGSEVDIDLTNDVLEAQRREGDDDEAYATQLLRSTTDHAQRDQMNSMNEAACSSPNALGGDILTDWAKRKRSKQIKAALIKETSNARWPTTNVPAVFRNRFPHLFAASASVEPPPPDLPSSSNEPG